MSRIANAVFVSAANDCEAADEWVPIYTCPACYRTSSTPGCANTAGCANYAPHISLSSDDASDVSTAYDLFHELAAVDLLRAQPRIQRGARSATH